MIKHIILVLALFAAGVGSARADNTINDAAWLAGRWVGEGLGGTIEETWAPPVGGQMVGHFRLVNDGAPVFYEILLMDQDERGVRMRVKHFNPDFVAWEDRDGWHEFAPVSATADLLMFSGLSIRRVSADEIEMRLRLRHEDGVREERLVLRRAPL